MERRTSKRTREVQTWFKLPDGQQTLISVAGAPAAIVVSSPEVIFSFSLKQNLEPSYKGAAMSGTGLDKAHIVKLR